MGSWTVTFNSGWVTCAFLYLNPIGLMNLSYFIGRRVKSGPTWRDISILRYCGSKISIPKVGLVIILFHDFFFVFFPVPIALNISSSLIPLTFGNGTEYFAAFSERLFLMALDSALAFVGLLRSRRYCGKGVEDGSGAADLTSLCSVCLILFFICIFSFRRVFWYLCCQVRKELAALRRSLQFCPEASQILTVFADFVGLARGALSDTLIVVQAVWRGQ